MTFLVTSPRRAPRLFALVRHSLLGLVLALSVGTATLATTPPAEAFWHGHHHHRHMGFFHRRGGSGFHSCRHRSYGYRGVHFRRYC